jgi:hypothetical protein
MKALQAGIWLGVFMAGSLGCAGEMLLAFTAEWCGPCQQFKRDYMADKELTAGYEVEIIDGDRAKEMAKDFEVKSYPTFIVVKVAKNGVLKKDNVVKRQAGYTSAEKFKDWLKR